MVIVGCPSKLVSIRNNRNWNRNQFRHYPKQNVCFGCFASIPKQRVSMFRLNRNKQKTNRNSLIESNSLGLLVQCMWGSNPLYDSIVNSKFIQYIPVRQVMYILNNSPINCVVQWLEGKINILFYSILSYSIFSFFSVFSVFSVFSFFSFFFVCSVCFETVCFSCFASIRKQRVSIEPKQTEDPPKQFKREYIWEFFRKFRVVPKQICLFRLFRYSFETPKQTEFFSFWFHETNRNERETDPFSVCFGSNRNLFLFVSRTPQVIGLIINLGSLLTLGCFRKISAEVTI